MDLTFFVGSSGFKIVIFLKTSDVTKDQIYARHDIASFYLTFRNTSLIIQGTTVIRLSLPVDLAMLINLATLINLANL